MACFQDVVLLEGIHLKKEIPVFEGCATGSFAFFRNIGTKSAAICPVFLPIPARRSKGFDFLGKYSCSSLTVLDCPYFTNLL